MDPSFDPGFVYTEPTKLMDIPPSLCAQTYIIGDINNMPFLPHEKEPFNEGGRIVVAWLELRVACIWIFQSMKKMQRKKNVLSA